MLSIFLQSADHIVSDKAAAASAVNATAVTATLLAHSHVSPLCSDVIKARLYVCKQALMY